MFKFQDISHSGFDLKTLKSDIFNSDIEHLFSTRLGADTPKPLDSFTLSAKDYLEYDNFAQKNIEIACEIIGGSKENLLNPNQQHTDKIAVIKSQNDALLLKEEAFDGVVTNLKGFPILLVFADCIPILLFDEKEKVLSCVHAGWKGTAKGIAQKAVKIMISEFNSKTENIKAAIGAGICQKCFEVNTDVATQLGMSIKNSYGNIFLEENDKVHVDLKELNRIQLNEVGVENTDICEFCTCCNNDIFYSYRADNKITGRHGLLAIIKERL